MKTLARLIAGSAAALLLAAQPVLAQEDPPDQIEETSADETEGRSAEPEDLGPRAAPGSLEELDDLLGLASNGAKLLDRGDLPEDTVRLRAFAEQYESAFDADYLRFLQRAGREEVDEWPALFGGRGAKGSTEPAWTSLGPTRADQGQGVAATDSGQILSIATHPTDAKTLWVATGGGGVWKTTDGGASWAAKTDTLGSLSCGAIAVDPADPQKLYLGLGEPFNHFTSTGVGLVRSTDGGETWSEPALLGDSRRTRAIVVVPGDGGGVLAATDAGVFRSTDGGRTWANVLASPPVPPVRFGGAWALVAAGNGRILASTQGATEAGVQSKVWSSGDAGITWKESPVPGSFVLIALAAAPSAPDIVYALGTRAKQAAEVLRSEDGGTTWKAIGVAEGLPAHGDAPAGELLMGQESYNAMIIVHPKDPGTAFVAMVTGVVRATLASGKWTFRQLTDWVGEGYPYVHADFHTAAYDRAGVLYVGTDGGIFRTADDGATWSDSMNVGIVSHRFYSVASSLAEPAFVVGGLQDAGSRARVGSTSTFNLVGDGDGFGSLAHPKRPSEYLVSVQYGLIYRIAGGKRTSVRKYDSRAEPFFTRVVAWEGSSTGDDVFTHSNTAVWRSTDFGVTWKELGTTGLQSPLRNVAVAPSSDQVLAVIDANGLVLTRDGGTTWTRAAEIPGGQKLAEVTFAKDPGVLYVAGQHPDARAAHLWRSADSGRTWRAIDGATSGFPAGVPVNSITVDPRDDKILYAGTHLGLYRSTDTGEKWARYGAGLPLVSVMDLYLAPDNSFLRVATFGRGIWELRPGGAASAAPEDALDDDGEHAPSEEDESPSPPRADDDASSELEAKPLPERPPGR